MGQKNVELRPNHHTGPSDLGEFLKDLLGYSVPCTESLPPIYFFKATEEQLEMIKDKYGQVAKITAHDVEN
ncbi:hypothetical protein PT974_10295 [Cladobotryum mycophilum]|uniref:Uncharacterized protein n=1 Tax=Cladobotryum mycophilum TaxID=491253 RepID=A0ABR0S9Z7_9HYPO